MKSLSTNSRMWRTRQFTNADGQPVFSTWVPPLNLGEPEQVYTVIESDLNRPDWISQMMYGTPDYWWVILWYNNLPDAFGLQPGQRLQIPAKNAVIRELARAASADPLSYPEDMNYSANVPVIPRPITLVPNLLTFLGDIEVVSGTSSQSSSLFNFGFEIPDIDNHLHFQVQFSTASDFSTLTMSRFSLTNQTNWYYFDQYASGGVGNFIGLPSSGVVGESNAGNTAYYAVTDNDPLVPGTQYYVRWRYWEVELNSESSWFAPPPINF